MEVRCNYCGQPAKLVNGTAIYPHRADLSDRRFWLCAPCGAYVGTHKNSLKHAPLGRLATAELRLLKMQVHTNFDVLWKAGFMSRQSAYAKLAEALGIDAKECHIGMFDESRCRAALEWLKETKRNYFNKRC